MNAVPFAAFYLLFMFGNCFEEVLRSVLMPRHNVLSQRAQSRHQSEGCRVYYESGEVRCGLRPHIHFHERAGERCQEHGLFFCTEIAQEVEMYVL